MNLVFLGASRFGLRCLDLACRAPACTVSGVVTAPQRFSISYRPDGVNNVLYADVGTYAEDRGLPSRTLARSMAEPGLLEAVASWEPDAFLVAGWYHMVPKAWRELAPAYGLHASLLPDYSGGAPLVWAMINGESKTGITLFKMDDGVDSGPIIGQAEEPILATDTIGSLYARIEERGLELLEKHLPALAAGTAELRVQDESARRVFPQRSPEDGWIDWHQDATAIDRFIRAQTRPYPGALTSLADGRRLTIWSARLWDENCGEVPSSLTRVGNFWRVQCARGSLLLQEVGCDGQVYESDQLESVLHGTSCLGVIRPNELFTSP